MLVSCCSFLPVQIPFCDNDGGNFVNSIAPFQKNPVVILTCALYLYYTIVDRSVNKYIVLYVVSVFSSRNAA